MLKLNILVIEDEPKMQELLRRLLERDGHTISVAKDGLEGIDIFKTALAQQRPFDLVITDFGLPQMNGGEVAKVVKSLSPSTPIILLSGWDSRSSADEGIFTAIDFTLDKPTTSQDLKDAIKKVMSQGCSVKK